MAGDIGWIGEIDGMNQKDSVRFAYCKHDHDDRSPLYQIALRDPFWLEP
jgi:hypothetical protein